MPRMSSLHVAAEYGDVDMVKALVEHLDVNEREPRLGRTPLHLAVKRDDYEISRVLLENGARATDVSNDNLTALHIAVANRSSSIVELLLENGADVNLEFKFCGKTPLYMAVDYNCPKIVEILLRAGASMRNAATPNSTLLDVAARIGSSLLWNMLLWYAQVRMLWDFFEKQVPKERKANVQSFVFKYRESKCNALYVIELKRNSMDQYQQYEVL